MFITFEGPEGSGKTTQFQRVFAAMQAAGVAVLATREPGGTRIGEQVRDILLNRPEGAVMTAETEALLFSAARAQHVREVIRPALAAGQTVLCDRFYDSTLAYQGYGRGLDLAALHQITVFATGGLTPDVTVYLDCPPEVGLGRKQSQAELNRLDRLALAFHRRVYAGYREMMQQEPERWVAVDATPGPDEVFARIAAALHRRGLRL